MRAYIVYLLAAAALALCGCADSGASGLSGAVTYNGEPVEDGYITFSPTGSGTSFGAKVAGGRYAVEQVKSGEFTVAIQGKRAGAVPKTRAEAEQLAKAQAGKSQQSLNYIPENAEGYNQTIEIKDGVETLDFALTGPPRQ